MTYTSTVQGFNLGYMNSALRLPYATAILSCGHVASVAVYPSRYACAACDKPATDIGARLGGEGDHVVVHRFGHWACGWWEALAVLQGTPEHAIAVEITKALEDYPVLDDEAFSQAEQTAADQVWRNCYQPAERIKYIRDHRNQFEFHDYADMRACIRGGYFAGYASELIG